MSGGNEDAPEFPGAPRRGQVERAKQATVVDEHHRRGADADREERRQKERAPQGRVADLHREEVGVEAKMMAFVGRHLEKRSTRGGSGKARGNQSIANDADHFGHEKDEELQTDAGKATRPHENARGPAVTNQLAPERAHQCGKNARVPPLFFHEELERSAVVEVDTRKLNMIDLAGDATFAGLSQLKNRKASHELTLKRNPANFSGNDGKKPGALDLEMTSPSCRFHVR